MTWHGPAEQDLAEMLKVVPRDFTTEQAIEATGWELKKVRQAIVMGLSQDKLIPREIARGEASHYKVYENVAWRREWVTKSWAA